MTNPFTAFAFEASGPGVTTAITLPDRLAYVKNVKDFGATGDGVTDDLAAIMAAYNWSASSDRGTIFFPPGTYFVSAPIDFSDVNVGVFFVGVSGASTVTGNFADYVFKRAAGSTSGDSFGHTVENLTIINTNAAGGGIRIGFCVGAAVRNCVVTANKGINTASDDSLAGVTTQECNVENCTLSPGSNVSGSEGILTVSDGPILNCTVIGYETGARFWGQAGSQNVLGCRFESCSVGIAPGTKPGGTSDSNGGLTVSGCVFKNCSTAIQNLSSFVHMCGIQITGTNSAAPGGANPQYGINIGAGAGGGRVEGVTITGQYDVAGIAIAGGEGTPALLTFIGVQSVNSGSGVNWVLPSTAMTAQFIGCNIAPTYTMAKLPARTFAITSISGDGTTVTIVSSALSNWLPVASPGANIVVSGVSPGGFNGTFNGANVIDFQTVTYLNATSGAGSGGSFIATPERSGIPNASEGDTYNVTDANTSTWGSFPTGGGSTHALVRMNSTLNWSVMGI